MRNRAFYCLMLASIMLVFLTLSSCSPYKEQSGTEDYYEDSTEPPGVLIVDDEVFLIAMNQPDDLKMHSKDFVLWRKITSSSDMNVPLGDAYKFGEDAVVYLNSTEQYYLYNPFEKCGRFNTGERLDEEHYREYMDEQDGFWSGKLKTFLSKLRETEEFSFFSLIEQPIYIYDKDHPDEFLDGYEDPTWDHNEEARFVLDGKDMAFVKAIQVSEKFFSEYDISVFEGSIFDTDDYNYDLKTNTVPVLLGHAYIDYYKVGDVLTGEYLTSDTTYIVKGFLEEGTKYWEGTDFKSLDRFIVLPAFITEDSLPFAKAHLLQQTNGIIVSEKNYGEVLDIYEKYIKDSGLEEWELYVQKLSISNE